jgi:hypothetical protein
LSENLIVTAERFQGHQQIIMLDLRKNKLTSCKGICNMPQLEQLFLGENEIADTDDLEGLPKLKKLDLNTNKLTHLKSLPRLESIQEIDVATNTIASADNISALAKYPTLVKFNGAANPMTEELADKFKQEVLFRLYPGVKLRFLGEEEIVEDDITQWKAERKERLKA